MAQQDFHVKMGRLSGIVTALPAGMGVGWILGYYVVDRYLDTFPWGTISLVFLGAGAGFYQVVRMLTDKGSQNRA